MVLNAQMFIRKNVLFVRMDGELDQHAVEGIRFRITELIEKYQIKYMVLNFSKLSFMDSSGVGFIIGRYNRLKQDKGGVILCALNEHIKRLVMLSGLNKICMIRENEDAAIEMLGAN